MTLNTGAENARPQAETENKPTESAHEYALDHLFTRKNHTRVVKRKFGDRLVSGRHGKLVFEQTFALSASEDNALGLNDLAEMAGQHYKMSMQMIVDCDKDGQPNRKDIIECYLRGKEERKYLIMPSGYVAHIDHPHGHPSFDFLQLLKYVDVDITAESVG
jgi:hypothetical protein